MSGDWQVGDLAVCVDDGPPRISKGPIGRRLVASLRLGQSYRVVGIRRAVRSGALCLRFTGFDYRISEAGEYAGFDANRFRKILPDRHEPCEQEFVTLLKRTKKTVRA